MGIVRPWGHIDWLLPRIGNNKKWSSIVCASFEPRCVAVPQYIANLKLEEPHFVVRVNDPPNEFSQDIRRLTDHHQENIISMLGKKINHHEIDLLAEPGRWNQVANDAAVPGASLILDITSMPKRAFLFLIKQLRASSNVQDLVVTYTRAAGYMEGRLTGNAEPPAALPGFARVASNAGTSTVIVSVGYMAFNLGELLEQSRGKVLKFLFPFPPGSPASRRNWNLLHQLAPDIAIQTEIRRLHAMDMFAALDWLTITGNETAGAIDLIPLGPKPHAMAMALACGNIGDNTELLYSQPRVYHPNYSSGVAKTQGGKPDVLAYCLRRNFKDYV